MQLFMEDLAVRLSISLIKGHTLAPGKDYMPEIV